jgi:HAD superfamily hydrolase (TIGR01509 family)
MIHAVIFDCDGVLVDSEILAHEVELSVLAELGLHYDVHEFKARFMGMSDRAFHVALEEEGVARLGRSIIDELAPRLASGYAAAMHTRLAIVPGAGEAVRAVTCAKAVASSSTAKGLERKLRKVGLWEDFAPHVYSADHVEHSKPAPDLFLHAAAKLDTAPQHCLVIEDSVNGVRAARAAGMRVWGLMAGAHMDEPARQRLIAAEVERVVEDWLEVAALFRELPEL